MIDNKSKIKLTTDEISLLSYLKPEELEVLLFSADCEVCGHLGLFHYDGGCEFDKCKGRSCEFYEENEKYRGEPNVKTP